MGTTAEGASLLAAFLDEDLGRGDVTTESIIDAGMSARGRVESREPAVIAGLEEAVALARAVELDAHPHAVDGDDIGARVVVLEVSGPAHGVLGVERTLLNIMSHMSGVATLTREAVTRVATAHTGKRAPHPPRISATRKTLPGLRSLQKKAVVLGGGSPHRFDLADAILIKDNHLALGGDIAEVLRRAGGRGVPVEIEIESVGDALLAARAGADTLLLDNLGPTGVTAVVEALDDADLRGAVSLEASGGITLDTVAHYADTGVDVISMGVLTSSARHIDFTLHVGD